MSTLVLSPRLTADSEALGAAARDAGWVVERLTSWRPPERLRSQDVAIYGEALFAEVVAAALDLVLIEAPPHWLESLPEPYLRRRVWHSTLGEAREQSAPVFVKPADGKSFPAAVYASGIDLPDETHLPSTTAVLMAEPVDWAVEYRCFVLERTVTTLSPYLRHGQLAEAEDGTWPAESGELEEALAFANAFLADHTAPAPPATVVDVGYIRGRGRAVVEANGAWASGICGADPARVLPVLARATIRREDVTDADRPWVRPPAELF